MEFSDIVGPTAPFGAVAASLGPKILVAMLCGGLIGIERELKSKAAGIKTNMLICVGAALYTGLSLIISESLAEKGHFGDPARVAAQIVSGIGFLGGGAIIQSRGTVVGLTTAAVIWVVAAIGTCIGLGFYAAGIFATLLVLGLMIIIRFPMQKLFGRVRNHGCRIVLEKQSSVIRREIINTLEELDLDLDDLEIKTVDQLHYLTIHYHGGIKENKKFILSVWGVKGVREVHPLR